MVKIMRKTQILTFIIILFTALQISNAKETVDQIITKSREKTGTQFLEDAKSLHIEGEASSPMGKVQFKLFFDGDKIRIEQKVDTVSQVIVYDGKYAHVKAKGETKPFSIGKVKQMAHDMQSSKDLLLGYDFFPEEFKIVGSEKVNGENCFKIAIKTETALDGFVYISKKSYLIKRFEIMDETKQIIQVMTILKHKKIKNVYIPIHTKIVITKNNDVIENKLLVFEYDVKLDKKYFVKPE